MACATFMRGWQDFDYVQLILLPLFLFSTTFYPLSTYPRPLQVVVWLSPLFHGVQLVRGHLPSASSSRLCCSTSPSCSPVRPRPRRRPRRLHMLLIS